MPRQKHYLMDLMTETLMLMGIGMQTQKMMEREILTQRH
jgi:hypothetical protein